MKRFVFFLTVAALFLSACSASSSAPATPALSAEDVQSTAVAMAWTMAAQTAAAMPTETPVPTDTPTATPSPTLAATPTPFASATPMPTATEAKDACDQPLMSWGGQSAPIVVDNRTNEQISAISIYVSYTARGECGYVPANAYSFSVPYGCFYAYAWMTGKKNYSTSGGPFCVNNPDKWLLVIKQSQITLKSP